MGVELFDGFTVKPYQKRRTQTGDRAELRHLFVSTTQRRAYGLRDEEYLRLKVVTCMLPEFN